jgi:hypothetical protein
MAELRGVAEDRNASMGQWREVSGLAGAGECLKKNGDVAAINIGAGLQTGGIHGVAEDR